MESSRRRAVSDASHGASTRHERTKQTRADASYVDFTYDNLGQLQSARGYTSGGTPLTTEQKGYKYDAGWPREMA